MFSSTERYRPFGELPEDYPFGKFSPTHPSFARKANVDSGMGTSKRQFLVDLEIGECNCQKGHAWAWDNKNEKWYANAYCSHKLKMIASVVDAAEEPKKRVLFNAYIKAVGTRYNQWEVVSAFHKELRRGDFPKAFFWGLILSTKRSYGGVIKYLNNIIYEETRDHKLAHYLLTLANLRMDVIGYDEIAKAIRLFCLAKKKWEFPHRLQIFEAEMRGYAQLVKEYGPDVAKGGNIIGGAEKPILLDDMMRGLGSKGGREALQFARLVRLQHGLKGLQKLQYGDLDQHRYWLYEKLYDFCDAVIECTDGSAWDVIEVINQRVSQGLGIGYHELNALADAAAGEPCGAGNLAPRLTSTALRAPSPDYPLAIWPAIPLYAHDNHSWRGKSLLRRFPEELEPGASQENLDFRLCGAYYGVAWRMLAYSQFGSIDVPWGDVKWPKWLIATVKSLWY